MQWQAIPDHKTSEDLVGQHRVLCIVWRGGDVVQTLTSLDKGATILSIDGVGAYDTGSSVARGDRHGSWGQDDPLRPAILFFSVHIFVGRRGGGDKKDSAG